jgi:hypothetical protein
MLWQQVVYTLKFDWQDQPVLYVDTRWPCHPVIYMPEDRQIDMQTQIDRIWVYIACD